MPLAQLPKETPPLAVKRKSSVAVVCSYLVSTVSGQGGAHYSRGQWKFDDEESRPFIVVAIQASALCASPAPAFRAVCEMVQFALAAPMASSPSRLRHTFALFDYVFACAQGGRAVELKRANKGQLMHFDVLHVIVRHGKEGVPWLAEKVVVANGCTAFTKVHEVRCARRLGQTMRKPRMKLVNLRQENLWHGLDVVEKARLVGRVT